WIATSNGKRRNELRAVSRVNAGVRSIECGEPSHDRTIEYRFENKVRGAPDSTTGVNRGGCLGVKSGEAAVTACSSGGPIESSGEKFGVVVLRAPDSVVVIGNAHAHAGIKLQGGQLCVQIHPERMDAPGKRIVGAPHAAVVADIKPRRATGGSKDNG